MDKFISDRKALQRMRAGPWGPYLDAYAEQMRRHGYTRATIYEHIEVIAHCGSWLEQRHLGFEMLDEKLIDAFVSLQKFQGRPHPINATALRTFLELLRHRGVVAAAKPQIQDRPLDDLLRSYAKYLDEERGLCALTVKYYLPIVRQFLIERFGPTHLRPTDLKAVEITSFIQRHARDHCPKRAQLMVTVLRSFLRFLLSRRQIARDLAACIPSVANWRQVSLPKSLEAGQVEEVLRHCHGRTSMGRRDHAILLLLARLGLRAGEVVALTLDDIDWETGEITILGKGQRRNRLPLPRDVGQALVTYLKDGRAESPCRRVFLRSKAPVRGFANSVAISEIVCRALHRAGLHPPRTGAHLFRHALAIRLLGKGRTLNEIREILGHQHLDTTAIYAKVDLPSLQALAQPWPGGA